MASSVWVEPQYVTPIRFIAEYYTFEYLILEEELDEAGQRFDLRPLGSLGRLFAGPFGSTLPTSVFVDEGIPLLRVQNVGELEILTDNLVNIGWNIHQKIIRSKLISGDLAIAKAGRIGTTAIIPPSIVEIWCEKKKENVVKSPKLPTLNPFHSAPCASQQSSITYKSNSSAISMS